MLFEHRKQDIDRRDGGLCCAIVLPDCPVDSPVRMLLKQHVPEERVTLLMQARRDDLQPRPQGEVLQVRVIVPENAGP